MEDQEKKDQIFSYAVENFKNGLNCAECVYDALIRAGVLEVPPETRAMCTGFGGVSGSAVIPVEHFPVRLWQTAPYTAGQTHGQYRMRKGATKWRPGITGVTTKWCTILRRPTAGCSVGKFVQNMMTGTAKTGKRHVLSLSARRR